MLPYVPLSFFLSIISTSHGLNITVPLIHRDSIYSPLYNATETIEDRAQRVAKASLDRYEYLSSTLSIRPEAKLVPGFENHAFFISFSIGTPRIPQLALMDTGSTALWVKCKPCSPCKHGPKDPPIFDLAKSWSSYKVPCQKNCEKCIEGIYVKDQITFETSIYGTTSVTLKNFMFGCSNYLTDRDNDLEYHFNGVIGLGTSHSESYFGNRPLIWDLGYKFSYCVGRLSDRSYPYNSISFGANAKMTGMETPIYTDTGSYYVNLIHISIGGKILDIDREVFREMSYMYDGMLVDSGTEITYLPNEALDVIKAEVKRQARRQGMKLVRNTFRLGVWGLGLCYRGTVFKDAHGLPPMGFHFKNGGSAVDPVMKVQSFGMFYQVTNDIFCLAIRGTRDRGILGMMAQQQYNFGNQVKHKKINLTLEELVGHMTIEEANRMKAMSPYVPMAFFLFIISTLIFSTSHGVNITVPLIHRDSIYSPLYNATETIEDRAQRVAKASLDRYEYLSSALSIRPEATLVPGFQSYAFYMNFSIGTPPVPQLVLMDTGSALLWVKCKPCSPCKHGPKDPPIFDPVKSSTIYEVPCEEKCKSCTAWPPWAVKKCKFTQKYVDGSVSDGIYMKDRLIFQTSANGRTSETFESYFGCSNYQTDKDTDLDKHFSGVIGLGPSKPEGYLGVLALIWDLGSKFSYCVGRFSDRNYPYNSISFGANANMLGMETPMYSGVGTYHVNLLNISIGDKILNIDPKVFKRMSRKYGGMIVDSGSEITLLPDEALDVIKAEVKRIAILQGMKQLRTTFGLGMWQSGLCFTGTVFKDAHGFPPMGFHFEQGDIFETAPEPFVDITRLKKLIRELDRVDGYQVLMSNIHAGEGDWRSVDKVRKGMRDNGLQKLVGLSWMKEKQRVEDVIQKERQRVARLEAIVTQLSTTVLKAADEPFPYIDQEASDDEQAQASEKDDD
ncbi:Aspartic proteinase CDR1 [Linum perenne]